MTTCVLLRHIGETAREGRAGLSAIERLGLRVLSDPGAFLAILAGIMLITTNSSYYLHARWLHIKFIFVLLLMALRVIVGTRTKTLASGRITLARGYARLRLIVVVLACLSIILVTLSV